MKYESPYKPSKGPGHLPKGLLLICIDYSFKGYYISAYPGPKVVGNMRAEHLPYHCHVSKNGKSWRIELSDKLIELGGKEIPKDLEKHLIENKSEIFGKVVDIFDTGKTTK